MEKSKVYFTDMRVGSGDNLLMKLQRLIKKAGIMDIDMKDKFIAIKMHFGEPGNLSFLRPNFAKAVADVVKENGGKPFLTDCNTLYVGTMAARRRWINQGASDVVCAQRSALTARYRSARTEKPRSIRQSA